MSTCSEITEVIIKEVQALLEIAKHQRDGNHAGMVDQRYYSGEVMGLTRALAKIHEISRGE